MIDRELGDPQTGPVDPVKVHEAPAGAAADVTGYLDQVRRFLDRVAG